MKNIIDNWKLRRLTKQPLKNNEDEINRFIADLKSLNQGIIPTMGHLCRKLKISIPESRDLVLNSPSWMDEKENFIEFNNQFMDALEEEE
jgi:UDP-2,3-diacylglucosamine pyrophosphatase LpxH